MLGSNIAEIKAGILNLYLTVSEVIQNFMLLLSKYKEWNNKKIHQIYFANQRFSIYFLVSNSAIENIESITNILLLKLGKSSYSIEPYLPSVMLNVSFIRCIVN